MNFHIVTYLIGENGSSKGHFSGNISLLAVPQLGAEINLRPTKSPLPRIRSFIGILKVDTVMFVLNADYIYLQTVEIVIGDDENLKALIDWMEINFGILYDE